jgi:DNA-binding MarR family transcriptional regulator
MPEAHPRGGTPSPRSELEAQIFADLRAMTAASEHIGRAFSALHHLHPTDFRALLHIMVADTEGTPLTAGELGTMLGLSSAAMTYLGERMTASGHIRRESDANDRRKSLLRYNEPAMEVAREFFGPLGQRTSAALTEISDEELRTAHKVFGVLTRAMREHGEQLGAGQRKKR